MRDIDIKKGFVRLAGELSPENLHCDGEISVAAARSKERILRKEWAKLETAFGRPVSETEVYTKMYSEVMRIEDEERRVAMAADPKHPKLRHADVGHWQRMGKGDIAYRIYTGGEGFMLSFSLVALRDETVYPSLEAAIEAGDERLKTVTPEWLRQRFPQWMQFAIDREMARASVH